MDLEPSERVPIRSAYLKAFKRVVLTPEILPDGTALVCFNVHHRLLPPPYITIDWVIRNKPGWLEQRGIRRVRHRYESPGKGYLTAEWIGVAAGVTPMGTFQTPRGEVSYFDYHKKLGHIPPDEGERLGDKVLKELLERSLGAFRHAYEGRNPKRITLHRDGRFFEALDILLDFEQNHGIGVDVLEVIKSGSPPLFRRSVDPKGKAGYRNPEVGDAFLLKGLDELIVSLTAEKNWPNMGQVCNRPALAP